MMKLNQTWMKAAMLSCGMMMMVGCVAQVLMSQKTMKTLAEL